MASFAMAQQTANSTDRAPGACPVQRVWLPINGTVTDAATGEPIAQARVGYKSRSNPRASTDGKLIDQPDVRGEARTANDGTFTLPFLPQGGVYEVRVAAPGYLSASENVHERIQGVPEAPPTKPPVHYCMARYDKPDCELTLQDGNFRLTPSSVELRHMSGAAQDGFGLPKENFLQMPPMRAAALSADGNKLALLMVLPHTAEHMADPPVCVGWTYDFRKDRLRHIEPQLPAKYCESLPPSLGWEGEIVVLRFDETVYGTQKIETSRETMRWQDGAAQTVSVERLPGPIDHSPKGFDAKDNETVLDKTDDERFVVVEESEDCRQCMIMVAIACDRSWQLRLGPLLGSFGTVPGYWLDHTKDLMVLFAASEQDKKQIGVQIVDLANRKSRFYPLPTFRGRPALVAARFLDDGRARVAYTMEGACDPFSPDTPYELPSYQGGPSHGLSLCLATLPAAGTDSAQQAGH